MPGVIIDRGRGGNRLIRFVKNVPPYLAGETAGFSEEYCARLVKSGHAEWEGEETVPEPEPPVTPEHFGGTSDETPTDAEPIEKPKHVGGGWYEFSGHRVKGKAKAAALYEELTQT